MSSLFRVCVKKSTQERLALKILIDRPKARNEVRGKAVVVTMINVWCFRLCRYAFVCLAVCYQPLGLNVIWFPVCLLSSLHRLCFVFKNKNKKDSVCVVNSVRSSLSMSSAAVCFDGAAHTAARRAIKTSKSDSTRSLNCESCRWQTHTYWWLPLNTLSAVWIRLGNMLWYDCVLLIIYSLF